MIQIKYENEKYMLHKVSEVWIPHVNRLVRYSIRIGEVDNWCLETYKDYDLDWENDFEKVKRQSLTLDENGLVCDYATYKLKDSAYYKLMYGI